MSEQWYTVRRDNMWVHGFLGSSTPPMQTAGEIYSYVKALEDMGLVRMLNHGYEGRQDDGTRHSINFLELPRGVPTDGERHYMVVEHLRDEDRVAHLLYKAFTLEKVVLE